MPESVILPEPLPSVPELQSLAVILISLIFQCNKVKKEIIY